NAKKPPRAHLYCGAGVLGEATRNMRAIGYRKASPALDLLEPFDIPRPRPEGRDLLVEVRAVSVNPVDYKVASGTAPEPGGIKMVGYDAAGVVAETGPEARLFKPSDAVFYAGSIGRQGADAEFHLVDGFVRVTTGRLRMAQHAQTQAATRPRGRATRPT